MLIFLNVIFYFMYSIFIYFSFKDLDPFSITMVFYIAPLIINMIFSIFYIKNYNKMLSIFISPVISVISYILIGIVVQNNGYWAEFASQYSVKINDVTITVASSLVTLSQISFIILLYLGINYLSCLIYIKRGGKK